jgi:hypothetical protein
MLIHKKPVDEPCEICGERTNDGYDIVYKTPKNEWTACRCKACRQLLKSVPKGMVEVHIDSKVDSTDSKMLVQHIDPWPV